MKSPDAELWTQACQEEIQTLSMPMALGRLIPLPKNRQAVGSKWVFKSQKEFWWLCWEIQGKSSGKRLLTAPWSGLHWGYLHLHSEWPLLEPYCPLCTQWLPFPFHDISSAFLNGDLEEEIYMVQPSGFEATWSQLCLQAPKVTLWLEAICQTMEQEAPHHSHHIGLHEIVSQTEVCMSIPRQCTSHYTCLHWWHHSGIQLPGEDWQGPLKS